MQSPKNIFSQLAESSILRGFVYAVVGILTYPGLALVNRLRIEGMDKLAQLPKKNVLFVSNHQS